MSKHQRIDGFSLIEVMFSMALLALVVVSFYKLPAFFSKAEKNVSEVVTKDKIFKGFSQNFIQIIERADVALRFQNFPISTSCLAGKPCVRLLEEENKGASFKDVNFEGLSSVQFFRDEKGELAPVELPSKYETRILSRVPYVFDRLYLEKEYYTTWPLVDESSEPFVLMRRGEVADHFLVEDAFVTSRRDVSDWVVVKGSRAGLDLTKVIGRPMLIYDVQDPSQYSAQKVIAAEDCSSDAHRNHCHEVVRSINESFDPTVKKYGQIGDSGETKTFGEVPFYIFQMKPFKESDMRFEVSTADAGNPVSRRRNFMPDTGTSATAWVNQDSSFYLFPTEVASVYGSNVSDLAPPVDAKLLGHFTHIVPGGTFALLPFDLLSYRLENTFVQKGGVKEKDPTGRKQLVLHTLSGKSSEVVLADIASGDQIVFARRLGRTELAVFHLK
ncbi:MAG: prepilin-type N-terminal cleavage/methylation domain-containing protein [Proteobacteria bacterium]|nr:MAG: prepilin-type N-terminal cleavage/methylation domain-containing protein [Pseudomonadota bacterium]